ncbi:hypothetical protein FYJ38_21990 [Clostridium sp. WB02_MRS01]|uniref:DUF5688 family protein n=1 Tax=Clostridium sp. WB02_MRS01 TaxID=2605777 RepID=UPI0012B421A5|nr:DUF5688 family protein [Clostridium sp. WB02_MRS01]MSS11292.1 hypothetical protein [Clostridium sp. WB02_MRS01]
MNYKQFLEEVRVSVQERLGSDYEICIQKITKNNGIVMDGLIIGKASKNIAPTIYLNSYYMHFTHGMSLQEIVEDIISAYKENNDVVLGDMRELLDFNNLRDKVAFKLIQREKNIELLNDVPYIEFLDLAVVFHLILDEHRGGQMTALIHNSHMEPWGVEKEELYRLAERNTPILLPPEIKTMREIMCDILKEHLGDLEMEEMVDDLLDFASQKLALYVLSNRKQINGAGCILYDGCLKDFADSQNSDIVILPSSTHEVILVLDDGKLDYGELRKMIGQINESEVPKEDVLSDRIYKYSRHDCSISLIE